MQQRFVFPHKLSQWVHRWEGNGLGVQIEWETLVEFVSSGVKIKVRRVQVGRDVLSVKSWLK